jgi:UPF0716 family protein affecting phage T7 exclusion
VGLFLFLFFVVMPLIELAIFLQVAQWIGVLEAFVLLMLISIAGVFIVRHQGLGVYRRVRAEIRAGIVPTVQLVDGLLILIAGVLLILPGFVTSVFGLLLLLPPVRNIAHRVLRRRFSVRVANRVVKVVNTRGSTSRDAPPDPVEVLPPAPRSLPPTPPGSEPTDGV